MRDKHNRWLLAGLVLSAALCTLAWNADLILTVHLAAIPFCCLQLLLCRMSRRWWLRALPWAPVVLFLTLSGFYLIRDSGWDRLAALVFALAAISPSVGNLMGLALWGVPILRRRKKEKQPG